MTHYDSLDSLTHIGTSIHDNTNITDVLVLNKLKKLGETFWKIVKHRFSMKSSLRNLVKVAPAPQQQQQHPVREWAVVAGQ